VLYQMVMLLMTLGDHVCSNVHDNETYELSMRQQ